MYVQVKKSIKLLKYCDGAQIPEKRVSDDIKQEAGGMLIDRRLGVVGHDICHGLTSKCLYISLSSSSQHHQQI